MPGHSIYMYSQITIIKTTYKSKVFFCLQFQKTVNMKGANLLNGTVSTRTFQKLCARYKFHRHLAHDSVTVELLFVLLQLGGHI